MQFSNPIRNHVNGCTKFSNLNSSPVIFRALVQLFFGFLTLWHPLLSYGASERPDVKNYKWRLNPIWHRMLYSCTSIHVATVGVKGLTIFDLPNVGLQFSVWPAMAM